ncbi:MAG: tRNA lysidine(34) synthetase TilS [Chloroflexi bacterium]|nr:tRNA lysidine(34) synthetase TilS [Chloroflexota bacterium]
MDDLWRQVFQYARRYDLFAPDAVVVAGVSGGPDSVCLLHVLRRLAPELGLRLHVAHLNHGLRGAEADADAAFVAALAAGWDVPCTIGRADVVALAEDAGLSPEEAARLARYRFLADVAEAVGATTITVGHNADDQAETVLMHFLRGSGVAGLRGMLPRTLLTEYRGAGGHGWERISEWSGSGEKDAAELGSVTLSPRHPVTLSPLWLVRPLLVAPRGAIETYCREHGLQSRFDRSNEDTTFFRNRLRHELLPILAGYNPAIREVLAHTAEALAGDYDVLRAEVAAAWARVCRGGFVSAASSDLSTAQTRPCVEFDLAAWRGLPLGLQRATIREAIRRLRHNLRNINWEHVETAVWLAREGGTGQSATLAAGLELRLGYSTLRIAAEGAAWSVDAPQVSEPLLLNAPGVTIIGGGWTVAVKLLHRSAGDEPSGSPIPAEASSPEREWCGITANPDPWTAYLDADAVGPELTLRPRAPGDRFQPQGLGGHNTKLNEFMINAKTPRDARSGWPLLVGRAGIAWVCGLRLDERAAVRDETREVWHVQLSRQVDK